MAEPLSETRTESGSNQPRPEIEGFTRLKAHIAELLPGTVVYHVFHDEVSRRFAPGQERRGSRGDVEIAAKTIAENKERFGEEAYKTVKVGLDEVISSS